MNPLASEAVPFRETEPSGDYPGIRFEPGRHPLSREQHLKIQALLISGDLNASIWNPEVATRVGDYGPAILAIDGQSPSPYMADDLIYSSAFKRMLWTNMPTRPQRTNPNGQIYTLSGDATAYGSYLQSLTGISGIEGARLSEGYAAILKQSEAVAQTKGSLGTIIGPPLVGLLIAGAAATAAAKEFKNESRTIRPKVSRRQFLRLAGITTAGVLLALAHTGTAAASALESSMATTEEGKQFWLNIVNIVRPRFVESEWLNARTALLIAKDQDAIDFLGLPKTTPSSVIMGVAHGYEAKTLMGNAPERKKTLSSWAGNLATSLDDFLDQEGLMDLRRPARGALLNYITSAEVFRITDPQGPDINPSFPPMIDTLVSPAGHFHSPRVEAAVHHLRI